MSYTNSYLAQPKYGYDTVVAVTQKALNNAIENYYKDSATTFTPVTYYFVKDSSGKPALVDKATLLASYTSNIDPLSVSLSAAQQKTLSISQFYFAFSFTIGNPQNDININYITLTPGSSNIRYYLLCKQLQVAFWNPDTKAWVGFKQAVPNEADIFANVNLKNVQDNTNLTPAVQAAVDTLGGTDVNIQQLIFDLDSIAVDPASVLPKLDSTCSVFNPLMEQFAQAYFSTYTAQSGALNYAITTQNSASLVPTKMDWYVGAFVDGNGNAVASPTEDEENLATLNYLFATNGDALNTGAQFNWNWLEDNGSSHNPDLDTNADVNKYDGAISINRDAFAKYLDTQLRPYILQNWWTPVVTCLTRDTPSLDMDVFVVAIDNIINAVPDGFQSYNGDPSIDQQDNLLSWTNSSISQVNGKWNGNDYLKVECYFSFNVQVYRGLILINQTLEFSAYENYGGNAYGGPVVLFESRDIFAPVIDDNGNLLLKKDTTGSTNSHQVFNTTFAGVDASFQTLFNSIALATFEEMPVSFPQQFVFPGGNAFTFQDAAFAGKSDIVCHFTYKAEL